MLKTELKGSHNNNLNYLSKFFQDTHFLLTNLHYKQKLELRTLSDLDLFFLTFMYVKYFFDNFGELNLRKSLSAIYPEFLIVGKSTEFTNKDRSFFIKDASN